MTDPYYVDEAVTLYLGDCREVTEWLAADVLVTDPPYGMGYQSHRREAVIGDGDTSIRDAALNAWRGRRPALVFGTWKVARPEGTRQVIVWDKSDGNGTGSLLWSPWRQTHEEIYLCGDWPPIQPGGRWREGGTPASSPGVLRIKNYNTQAASRPDHPTPKPVLLMETLISHCPPGVIADPFAGSGSTLVAARNLGRRAIGVEIDERYCEAIARRLSQDVLPIYGGG
jgi:site-specific DNA-methyltransferase (adenine-specific)